jgi:hypothetical protein
MLQWTELHTLKKTGAITAPSHSNIPKVNSSSKITRLQAPSIDLHHSKKKTPKSSHPHSTFFNGLYSAFHICTRIHSSNSSSASGM